MRGVLLSLLAVAALPRAAHCQTADPLKYIPPAAQLIIKIEKPRQLLESAFKLPLYDQAMKLNTLQRALDTADFRKFRDLVSYFEKELGKPWPELVDELAGGGLALGVRYADAGTDNPTMLVMQSRNEETLKKFLIKLVDIFKQEQERQGGKSQVESKNLEGFEAYHLDEKIVLVRDGSVLFALNQQKLIAPVIDHVKKLHASPNLESMANHPGVTKSRQLLPKNPDAWFWFDLAWAKTLEGAKGILEQPRNDPIPTFVFAGLLDLGRRSELIAGALTSSSEGYDFTLRLPAGYEHRGMDTILHLPKEVPASYSIPSLHPKNTLYSHAFYLDLAAFYNEREKIFNKEVSKNLADFQKQVSKVLPSASFEKLMNSTGPIHQVVIAYSDKKPYKTEPNQKIPPGAYIVPLRDKEASRNFEALVRAGGFLASTQVPLKMSEETYAGAKLLIYRFDETKPFPNNGDPENIRFNFAPTFVDLGDKLLFSSTTDLARELIDLNKAAPASSSGAGYENMSMEFNAEGGAALIAADPQAVKIQLILSQALREAEAQKEAELLIKYVRNLGVLRINTVYYPNDFRMNFRWILK